jgi:hypothetical protein
MDYKQFWEVRDSRNGPLLIKDQTGTMRVGHGRKQRFSFFSYRVIKPWNCTGCLSDYPDTKNTISLEQRYIMIYHLVHDSSHSRKYSVGSFLRCNVIIVITLQLAISPCSVITSNNLASQKAPNRIFSAVA